MKSEGLEFKSQLELLARDVEMCIFVEDDYPFYLEVFDQLSKDEKEQASPDPGPVVEVAVELGNETPDAKRCLRVFEQLSKDRKEQASPDPGPVVEVAVEPDDETPDVKRCRLLPSSAA